MVVVVVMVAEEEEWGNEERMMRHSCDIHRTFQKWQSVVGADGYSENSVDAAEVRERTSVEGGRKREACVSE